MKLCSRQSAGLVAAVACGLTPSVVNAEIVVNGGFETGSFFPWAAPPWNPPQSLFWVSGGGGHSGEYYARLSSEPLQYMSQVLPTTSGSDYELSFWLRRTSFTGTFKVRWEGQLILNQFLSNPDYMEWKHFTVPLHSDITGSLLEFGQNYFPMEFHIDDISVVAVPVPGAAAVLVMAGAVAARRRRG